MHYILLWPRFLHWMSLMMQYSQRLCLQQLILYKLGKMCWGPRTKTSIWPTGYCERCESRHSFYHCILIGFATFPANVDLPHGRLFYTKIIMCYKQLNNRKSLFLFHSWLSVFYSGSSKKGHFLTETFCFYNYRNIWTMG